MFIFLQKELSHLESYRLDYDKLRSKVKHNEHPDPEVNLILDLFFVFLK